MSEVWIKWVGEVLSVRVNSKVYEVKYKVYEWLETKVSEWIAKCMKWGLQFMSGWSIKFKSEKRSVRTERIKGMSQWSVKCKSE